MSPGLPHARDAALGDGLAPRPACARGSEPHVSSLGPPRGRACLPAPRGSGKTTELAVLADWLDAEGARIPASTTVSTTTRLRTRARAPRLLRARPLSGRETGTREDTKTTAIANDPDVAKAARPFRARALVRGRLVPAGRRARWRRRARRSVTAFGIAERLPRDAADLPRVLRALFERAALHRRVVVIVDACESARCAPCAGVGAAAVDGALDPSSIPAARRGVLFVEKRETTSKRASAPEDARRGGSTRTSTRTSPRPTRISWICAHTSSGSRSHRRSPCVSCSRAGRKDADFYKRRRASRRRGAAPRASPWRAPSSPARPRRELCTRSPHDGRGRRARWRPCRRRRSPTALARDTTRGAPNEARSAERVRAGFVLRARAAGTTTVSSTAALVNAAAPHGATPLYARVAARSSPDCARRPSTARGSLRARRGGSPSSKDEFSGGPNTWRSPTKVSRVLRRRRAPRGCGGGRARPGHGARWCTGGSGRRARARTSNRGSLRAVCLALAGARFGVTEREARRVARRVVDNETRRKSSVSEDFSEDTCHLRRPRQLRRSRTTPSAGDAGAAPVAVAPWTTRARGGGARALRGGRAPAPKISRGTDEARADAAADAAADDDDVPLTFRDAPLALSRAAPVRAAARSLRAGRRGGGGSTRTSPRSSWMRFRNTRRRRVVFFGGVALAAAGDYASLASLIGGSPGAVAAFRARLRDRSWRRLWRMSRARASPRLRLCSSPP